LLLWDVESGIIIRRFQAHRDVVAAIAVLLDGYRALSASWDGTLGLWDLETGAELRRLECSAIAIAVLPDGRRALSVGDHLLLWDLEMGMVLAAFTADAYLCCLSLVPDNQAVVAGDAAGHIHVLDILFDEPTS
jgi:WD40 repeat protein